MKTGVHEIHRKIVLAHADNDANKVVFDWKMFYINILKQGLSTAKTSEHNLLDLRSVVDRHRCHMAAQLSVFVDGNHSEIPTLDW